MRNQHLIAIALAFAAGFGVKQFFFSPSTAKAHVDAVQGTSVDVARMRVDAELPVLKLNDMTFVFSGAD